MERGHGWHGESRDTLSARGNSKTCLSKPSRAMCQCNSHVRLTEASPLLSALSLASTVSVLAEVVDTI